MDFLDLVLLAGYSVYTWHFSENSVELIDGCDDGRLPDDPTPGDIYTLNVTCWSGNDEYPFQLIMAIMAGTIWLKTIMQMSNT